MREDEKNIFTIQWWKIMAVWYKADGFEHVESHQQQDT